MSVLNMGQAAPPLREEHRATWALLRSTAVYRPGRPEALVEALREIATWHYQRNSLYRKYCEGRGFSPSAHLDGVEGLERLPHLSSEVVRHWLVEAPSAPGSLRTDDESQARAWAMLAAVMEQEGLVSARPVHHVLFARPPGRSTRPGGEQYLCALPGLAPPGAITYGLREEPDRRVALDDAAVAEALRRASFTGEPVRLIGLPALVARIARAFEAWPLELGPGSLVLTSGGWEGTRLPRGEFRALVERSLGVPPARVRDLYRLDEHAASYLECPEHAFHAPVFSRVRAVDPITLRPQPDGAPGVLALLNPGSTALPVHALLTGDVGRMVTCRCGRDTPAFEVLGRGGKGRQQGHALRLLEMVDR